MFTSQAVVLLIFLLPGFLSLSLLGMLTPSAKHDLPHNIVTALIFSVFSYAIYSLIFSESPVSISFPPKDSSGSVELHFAGFKGLLLLLISAVTPILIAWSVKKDWHMKLFRKMGVTDKTSRENIWFDVFTDIKSHIIINFEDGRRLYGWPEYYSDRSDDPTLFLCDASWKQEDEWIKLDNKGILITSNEKIDTIEFVKMKGGKNG